MKPSEKLRLTWAEILDANRAINTLVQYFLKNRDIEKADAAARIARQLRPSADLWTMMNQDLIVKYGTVEEGQQQPQIKAGTPGMVAFRDEVVELMQQDIPLPIVPIPMTIEQLSNIPVDLFVVLRPVLAVE